MTTADVGDVVEDVVGDIGSVVGAGRSSSVRR
jgi:hypothetical protein